MPGRRQREHRPDEEHRRRVDGRRSRIGTPCTRPDATALQEVP
ncbi:hypothetical protein ACFQ2M_34885 [Kitasatospora saccharophila]